MIRDSLQREIAQKIQVLARGWRQLADNALAELRVSNAMGWCLYYLERLGPEARQIDLAAAIGISQPSTVSVLNQLEAAGLVERVQNPDDKRSNRLVITPAGAAMLGEIETRLGDLRQELFAEVPIDEIAAMQRVVDMLSARIAERRG